MRTVRGQGETALEYTDEDRRARSVFKVEDTDFSYPDLLFPLCYFSAIATQNMNCNNDNNNKKTYTTKETKKKENVLLQIMLLKGSRVCQDTADRCQIQKIPPASTPNQDTGPGKNKREYSPLPPRVWHICQCLQCTTFMMQSFTFKESSSEDEGETSKKPEKPIYLKDYERQQLLEKGRLDYI